MILMLGLTSLTFELALGWALTWFCLGLHLISLFFARANLTQLRVKHLHNHPAYAGDAASSDWVISNLSQQNATAIYLNFVIPRRRREDQAKQQPQLGVWLDVAAKSSASTCLGLPTRRRGVRVMPRLKLSSRFPFGLWEAYTYANGAETIRVFPAPEQPTPPLPRPNPNTHHANANGATTPSGSHISGVRPYRYGDDLRMVAWRLSGRTDELCIRQFDDESAEGVSLNYSAISVELSVEQKLSRLTAWILEAEAKVIPYSLTLPAKHVPLGIGQAHRDLCLNSLAQADGA